MSYKESPYFHVSRASQLSGKDYWLYRFLEILPGFLSWATIFGCIILSFVRPVWAAIFIIVFDLYWLLKTIYLSIHLQHNWKQIRYNLSVDWTAKLSGFKYDHLYHLVILPFYNEEESLVEGSVASLLSFEGDKRKLLVVLATEERAGEKARLTAEKVINKYKDQFGDFIFTTHPKDVEGEMPGKGSNISFSAEEARVRILDKNGIDYKNVIVSAFDIDTVIYPKYFQCLTWYFMTAPNPYKVSFQPVPFYNNNIWQSPSFSRVVALSSTFWQMIQQERPERLATFSSHSVSFKALYEAGYWQRNMVSEDSRIFWNLFLANDGDYSVVPMSYPVSMDANLATTNWKTIKNIYKQYRRWSWGVENVPYILFGFIKNKNIALSKKIRIGWNQLEGFWSLATNPIIIFLLGWMPLILGGRQFNQSILSRNLPMITRDLMILSMFGLVSSAIITLAMVPTRPKEYGKRRALFMIMQWILVPLTIVIFGAIPGLDAQTRLMSGKYMGFWVTPKHRKK